jgi:hypothetical protein
MESRANNKRKGGVTTTLIWMVLGQRNLLGGHTNIINPTMYTIIRTNAKLIRAGLSIRNCNRIFLIHLKVG